MRRRVMVLLSLLAFMALGGCRTYVPLSSDAYVPRVADTNRGYQGAQLYLASIENRAEDTTLFYYYSASSRAAYGGPLLTSYLWYSLEKALMRLGIQVHSEPPSTPVPEMRLTLTSWTDQSFVCDVVLLFPGQPPLSKQYRLTFPEPGASPAQMEQHAYQQIDQIVGRIFGDPEFSAALLRAQPGGASRTGDSPPVPPPPPPPPATPAPPPPPAPAGSPPPARTGAKPLPSVSPPTPK
jgi:hypothetical protein